MGCCQGSPVVASLASSYECPNPFSVRDMTIFVIFFCNLRDMTIFVNSQRCSWVLRGYYHELQVANLEFKCDCSNALSFRDVTFVMSFFKIIQRT